ncbi:MAG: outer membrane beta-barrel protein [Verrucomicrobia bacterium]|nr:outer membrane beta-barrel protein [Verrucomicrobiota bacterium]
MNLVKHISLLSAAAVITSTGVSASPLLQLSDDSAVFLNVRSGLVYEDNLFRRSTAEVDDFYFTFKPGLEFVFGQGDLRATFNIGKEWRWYDNESALDSNFLDVNGRVTLVSGPLFASLMASYREIATNDINAQLDSRLVEREQTAIRADSVYTLSRLTKIGAGFHYEQTRFTTAGFTSNRAYSVPLTGYYAVSSNLDVTAGYRYRYVDVFGGPLNIDYRDHYVFVGLVGELFNPLWLANVNVGYQRRNFRGVSERQTAPSWDAGITYQMSALTQLSFGFSQDFYASSFEGRSYRQSAATFGVNHRFNSAWSANASLTAARSSYFLIDRRENQFYADLGLAYSPNEMWSFRAAYSYEDISGRTPISNSWSANKIAITASLRY